MTDAMQTIRDDDIANVAGFLELSTRKVTSIQMAVSAIASFERIKASLDSLAGTPSEDARSEAKRFFSVAYNAHMDTQPGVADMIDSFAALIQARDERIRREVCDKLLGELESVPYSDKKREGPSAYDDAIDVCLQTVNAKIAAILTTEANNGQ